MLLFLAVVVGIFTISCPENDLLLENELLLDDWESEIESGGKVFGDFRYKDNDETIRIIRYLGTGGIVIIPEKIDEMPVTSLEQYAFRSTKLTGVIFPDSIISVGNFAFAFNKITNVQLPNNVKTIGSCAFLNNQLTNITIPASVTTIGDYAFSENKLTNITISNNVTTIENGTFSKNQLTSVTIPDNITTIKSVAFFGNQLISITISADVSISEFAFSNAVIVPIITGGYYGHLEENGFTDAYRYNHMQAGKYTRQNVQLPVWTKQ